VVALVGCTGLIDDSLTPQQRETQAKWQQSALPVLRSQCIGCHDGSRAMVAFLEGTIDPIGGGAAEFEGFLKANLLEVETCRRLPRSTRSRMHWKMASCPRTEQARFVLWSRRPGTHCVLG
jgi:hypothetical protein